MPELGGFTVSVEMDDEALEEYQVERGEKKISCYIARVKQNCPLVDDSKLISGSGILYLDGRFADHLVFSNSLLDEITGELKCKSLADIEYHGFPKNANVHRAFMFSRIELAEESVAFSSSDLSKIGTIKLEVEYVRPQSMAAEFPPESFDNSNIKLSERTKKGGGHCCTLGDETEVDEPLDLVESELLEDYPRYEFVFHHASRDWLQAKEIIKPLSRTHLLDQKPETLEPTSTRVKERKRKIKTETGTSHLVELVSDTECLEDEEEREVYRKLREKIAAKRRKQGPVKTEPDVKPTVINISD